VQTRQHTHDSLQSMLPNVSYSHDNSTGAWRQWWRLSTRHTSYSQLQQPYSRPAGHTDDEWYVAYGYLQTCGPYL